MKVKKLPRKKGRLAMVGERIDLGLRVIPAHAEEISNAAVKDAQRRGVPVSRNEFCIAAVLAAARKVLSEEKV